MLELTIKIESCGLERPIFLESGFAGLKRNPNRGIAYDQVMWTLLARKSTHQMCPISSINEAEYS